MHKLHKFALVTAGYKRRVTFAHSLSSLTVMVRNTARLPKVPKVDKSKTKKKKPAVIFNDDEPSSLPHSGLPQVASLPSSLPFDDVDDEEVPPFIHSSNPVCIMHFCFTFSLANLNLVFYNEFVIYFVAM